MNRRRFLTGSAGLLLSPAIVRVSSLMPVSVRGGFGLTAADLVLPPHLVYGRSMLAETILDMDVLNRLMADLIGFPQRGVLPVSVRSLLTQREP